MYIDYPEGPAGNVRTTFWFDKNSLLCLDSQEHDSIDYQEYDGKESRYTATAYRGGLEDITLFAGTYKNCRKAYDGILMAIERGSNLCSITSDGYVLSDESAIGFYSQPTSL